MSALAVIDTLQDVPDDLIAGVMVTTSVPDRPIDGERLRALLIKHGLDDSFVPEPKKISDVNAFQNACRSVETRRGASSQGKRTTVAVGEAVTNSAESVYQITAEVRDEANRVIEHAKAMRVVYTKGAAQPISFEPLEPSYAEALKPLADVIQLRYDAMRERLTGAKVREILRAQFKNMHATRWARNSGVYMVSKSYMPQLEGMANVLHELYGNDAQYDHAPALNTRHVRETLGAKIGEHVADDAAKLMEKFAKKLGAKADDGTPKPLTTREFEHANEQRAELVRQAETMMAAYGEELSTVREALALVNEQMMAMWERTS